jgi:hypothetical protein
MLKVKKRFILPVLGQKKVLEVLVKTLQKMLPYLYVRVYSILL